MEEAMGVEEVVENWAGSFHWEVLRMAVRNSPVNLVVVVAPLAMTIPLPVVDFLVSYT